MSRSRKPLEIDAIVHIMQRLDQYFELVDTRRHNAHFRREQRKIARRKRIVYVFRGMHEFYKGRRVDTG